MAGPLVHIGYHKTGSTWLQKHLFEGQSAPFVSPLDRANIIAQIVDPGSFAYKSQKVARVYCDRAHRNVAGSRRPVISHERLSGYPASGGFDSELLGERLIRTFPGMKVLIVIREQRDLLLSWYTQYVRDGGSLSLRRYLELGLRRQVRRVPVFVPEFYEFDRMIAWYQDALMPANVLVLPYELLREAPQTFVNAVCKFAGVEAPTLGDAARENIGTGPLYPRLGRIGNRLFAMNQLSPNAIWDAPWFANRARGVTRRIARHVPAWLDERLKSDDRKRVLEYCRGRFGESNCRTSERIGIPLEMYGYDCVPHARPLDPVSG